MNIKKHIYKIKKYFHFLSSPYRKLKSLKNKNEKNQKLFRDIKNISIVLLCNFLFIIVWVNRAKFYPDNIMLYIKSVFNPGICNCKFPYNTDGNTISAENFQLCENNIVALGNTSFNIMSKNGKILKSEKHSFSNPCLKSSGLREIIYDRGGTNFKIESSSDTIFEGSADKNIISCDISENGVFAVAKQSISHLAEMIVYNKNGKEKYKYCFSDYYISDITLNSFGTESAACGIRSNNGNINSNVYIINFNSETPKHQFLLEDNMVMKVEYLSNGNIVAIGDKYTAFLNTNSNTTIKFDYENKLLKFYSIYPQDSLCLCLSSSVNETGEDEIIALDNYGKELCKIKTTESFSGISKHKNRIIGITKDKIMSYNSYGNYEGYLDFPNNAKKIILASHSNAFTLENGTINKVKIKNLKRD